MPTLHALNDNVVIVIEAESGEKRSKGGLIIPTTAVESSHTLGTIVSVGPEFEIDNGAKVIFDKDTATKVEFGGGIFFVVKGEKLLAEVAEQ